MIFNVKYAKKEQSAAIAGVMTAAMSAGSSNFFYSEDSRLDDLTHLLELEDSPCSYRNTLVAMDGDKVVGVSVSYDGGRLDNEAMAGELYLDCLAVHPDYRRKGIARQLIASTKERAGQMKLLRVGLLVDDDDSLSEALYTSVGFVCVENIQQGDRPKKHLVCQCRITYPMNALQKEMYDAWNQDRSMTQFNTTVAVDMPREKVPMERMVHACQKVLDCQRYLHSHLTTEHNNILICEDWTMPNNVRQYDMTDEGWDKGKDHLIKPFHLFEEPSMRLHVVGTETRTILIVETCHLLFDGTSHKAVDFAIMDVLQGGDPCQQGSLAKEFNLNEIKNYNTPAYNKAKAYYQEQIEGIKFSDICKKSDSPWGKTIVSRPHFPAKTIDDGCKRLGVSFAVMFYAAYALALSEMAGEQRVIFYTVSHGRTNRKLTNRIYGNFLSCLPVIIDTNPQQTVSAFVRQTRLQLFTSMHNRIYPLYHMLHDLRLDDVGTELSPQGKYIYEYLTVDGIEYPSYHIETDLSLQHLSTCILIRGDEYEVATDASDALYTQEQLDTLAHLTGQYALKLSTEDENATVGRLR